MNTLVIQEKHEFEGFSSLYYLIVEADGVVTEKEIAMGKIMCNYEKFDISEFEVLMKKYKFQDKQEVYKKCVASLRQCSYVAQVRCMAWMSNIANCDGFMSPDEWKLIFNIYKKELKLNQQEIIDRQRQLPKTLIN